MKTIFNEQLSVARKIENDSEKLTFLTSLLRSLLQSSVIITFEIIKELAPSEEVDLAELTTRFCKPTDGVPLQILDELTPVVRGYVSKDFLTGWFEAKGKISTPLSTQLVQWVEFRNKRPGHGVLDSPTTTEWVSKTEKIVSDCLVVFSKILPRLNSENIISPLSGFENILVKTPLIHNNHAIVVMNIAVRKGIWKLKGQLLSKDNADEFTISLPEDTVFNASSLKPTSPYDLIEIISNNKNYSFFHNIPVRQTDIFEGRKEELIQLQEWFDDEDSRYCLVYGDGGYGKTTLVLEMLNQFLESQYDFNEPLPTIISYHTAKMTRWTEEGLVHLTGVMPVMDECIRDLMRFFNPILSKDWYSVSGRNLIDKAVGILKENKLTRDDVLLIIDNTETLATKAQEVKDLGAFFKIVGKLIGRIIITSRRREFIEATPIVIEGLSAAEGVTLMQRLADEFNAKSISQAGEQKLRKVSEKLMHKPILLEALVKYISRSKLGIDAALENMFKKNNEDLLDFLYEDAWLRMNQLQKSVFFILINISSPLNQNTVSRACQEVGIQHTEFQLGLEETHFSVLTDYGRTYTLELVDLARRFFLQKFTKFDADEKEKIKAMAKKVDEYATERVRIETEYQTDRVAEAFRSEYAKAAKVYADKGDIGNAIEMYELAIEDDPVNAALHDRFSWFLLNKANKFDYAKEISEKAVELDDSNCDAVVGLALAYYRLNDIENGDKYIDKAEIMGRPISFCLLRKAIARYYKTKDIIDIDTKILNYESVLKLLNQAEKISDRDCGYNAKTYNEVRRYKEMTTNKISASKAQRTKMSRSLTN